jgi:hypothetical protein
MTRSIDVPSPGGLFQEALGAFELPRLLLRSPWLAGLPRGRGETVLVLPGYGAGDASTGILRGFLRALGYRAAGWGMGRNSGDVPALMPRVEERLARVADRAGARVSVIGWSLGGYLAREAARDRPELVERVITLGSPVIGGPKYTAVGEIYRRQGVDLDEIEAEVDARYEKPLAVPVTAIYSRSDRVVAWAACIDERSPDVEHVEVGGTHVGLGFSPDVYEVIGRTLARART